VAGGGRRGRGCSVSPKVSMTYLHILDGYSRHSRDATTDGKVGQAWAKSSSRLIDPTQEYFPQVLSGD